MYREHPFFTEAPKITDHVTARRLDATDLVAPGYRNPHLAEEIIQVGQIVVLRWHLTRGHMSYTFHEHNTGLALGESVVGYAISSIEGAAYADVEARQWHFLRALNVASALSQMANWAHFNAFRSTLTPDEVRELRELVGETSQRASAPDRVPAPRADGYVLDQAWDKITPEEDIRVFECAQCSFTTTSEDDLEERDGDMLCSSCVSEYDNSLLTCDRCGFESHDEDDFRGTDFSDGTYCYDCAAEVEDEEKQENHPSTEQWLENAWDMQRDDEGWLVFKSFGRFRQPPAHWVIAEGSVIEEDFDDNLSETCSYGINVGSLAWVVGNSWVEGNTWVARLRYEDVDDNAVVPYESDGKFRVGRLELLYRINQDGSRFVPERTNDEEVPS